MLMELGMPLHLAMTVNLGLEHSVRRRELKPKLRRMSFRSMRSLTLMITPCATRTSLIHVWHAASSPILPSSLMFSTTKAWSITILSLMPQRRKSSQMSLSRSWNAPWRTSLRRVSIMPTSQKSTSFTARVNLSPFLMIRQRDNRAWKIIDIKGSQTLIWDKWSFSRVRHSSREAPVESYFSNKRKIRRPKNGPGKSTMKSGFEDSSFSLKEI